MKGGGSEITNELSLLKLLRRAGGTGTKVIGGYLMKLKLKKREGKRREMGGE